MNKFTKNLSKILSFLLLFCLIITSFGCKIKVPSNYKNIIVMIGDGMGYNHIQATEDEFGEPLFMKTASVQGWVTTKSRNSKTTDSAAAATAMATGKKVNNSSIGMLRSREIQNISQFAKSKGKTVGIVATESIYGATPAGFSSHSPSRFDYQLIVKNQLKSNIDLFVGSEKSYFDDYVSSIENAGYEYVNTLSETKQSTADKLFACYEYYSLQGSVDMPDQNPPLHEVADFAVDFVTKKSNNKGYFLMIESSYIDKYSHSNIADKTLNEVREFDKTIQTVVEKVQANNDTLVIVLADHETGAVDYQGGGLSGFFFTIKQHSSKNVPYFVFGNIDIPKTIDNTNVFDISKSIMQN